MYIMIVDAQGGGLGRSIIEKLDREKFDAQIWAIGTNATATGNMIKAGATRFATGENAVVFNSQKADIIMGGIGIIAAHAMMGEITPAMAQAVTASRAVKILIPLNKCDLKIAGIEDLSLSRKIDAAYELLIEQTNHIFTKKG